jgi:hypothetical protein
MNRAGWAFLNVVDHLLDRDRTAARSVTREHPVRHQFGVDEARVGEDKTGYAMAVPTNGVANYFGFNHFTGRERIRMSDDTDRLIDEINMALGVNKEPAPPNIDNDAMRLIYEKAGEPIPVYPFEWADFYRTWLNR